MATFLKAFILRQIIKNLKLYEVVTPVVKFMLYLFMLKKTKLQGCNIYKIERIMLF